jgi:hypothetical protein
MKLSATNSSFSDNPYLRESHNCYSYFLNLKDPSATELCKKTFTGNNLCRRSQPGYAAGYKSLETKDFNCPEIVERTMADNPEIYKIDKNDTCNPEFYKGAIVVAPGHDYHYYRLNDDLVYYNGKKYNDVWSHKPGYKPNTYLDAKNKIITDPETASRNYGSLNYSEFCGRVCIPRDPSKKQMKMYNESNNRGPLKNIQNKLENTVKKIVRGRNAKSLNGSVNGGSVKGGSLSLRKQKTKNAKRNKKLNVKKTNKLY